MNQTTKVVCQHRPYPPGYSGLPWIKDKKGGDVNEWPESLRVREFPSVNVDK